MNFEDVINQRRIIDINLFKKNVITFTGVCIKANKNIWILINYNSRSNTFDGFSIFRNEDIETYELWKKKYLNPKNNLDEFVDLLPISKINTLYSCFKNLCSFGFFAVFDEETTQSYYVGKILEVNRERILIRLVDKNFNWLTVKSLPISKIKFLSFYTKYEKNIENKMLK